MNFPIPGFLYLERRGGISLIRMPRLVSRRVHVNLSSMALLRLGLQQKPSEFVSIYWRGQGSKYFPSDVQRAVNCYTSEIYRRDQESFTLILRRCYSKSVLYFLLSESLLYLELRVYRCFSIIESLDLSHSMREMEDKPLSIWCGRSWHSLLVYIEIQMILKLILTSN